MEAKKQKMVEALEKNLGIVTAATKVAGISRQTHYRWLEDDAEYKAAVEAIPEIVLDFAENTLYTAIQNGNMTATIFFLKTRGKDRGYIERIDDRQDTCHT